MAPRVALVTPHGPASARGNAITVERIARGLGARGVDLRTWDLSASTEAGVLAGLEEYRPVIVHAFHAFSAGPLGLRAARRLEAPLVVTLTGTDANHDLMDAERAPVVRRVLEGAARLVAFHGSVAERVTAVLPDLAAKIVVIPQAVRFEAVEPFDLGIHGTAPEDGVVFLLVAGLRRVKRPAFPLAPLARIAASGARIRFLVAGPVIERAEGEALQRAIDGLAWARYLGPVPHRQMASLLEQADVAVNCSLSEGGMANAVLEALALGRAVLAADIPGNRSLVEDGVTGLLFRDERQFQERALDLIREPDLRARLGEAGRALVRDRYTAEREIAAHVDLYARLEAVTAA
jgi:glycosyltransferase involved in cell wall biosynthesis